jgi:hypothetical protein
LAQTIVCVCNPAKETPKKRQQRSTAKHEIHYNQYAANTDTISVNYIYNWQKQYKSTTSTISTAPASTRVHDTPEDTLYTLKGYIWFVKSESNDCDLHIEIGPKNSGGTRIVIEVPKENKALQNKLKQHLESLSLKIKGCSGGSGDTHFQHGIPVLVTGLGFYDASHKPNGDSHTKKYSWELHPIKEIEFL